MVEESLGYPCASAGKRGRRWFDIASSGYPMASSIRRCGMIWLLVLLVVLLAVAGGVAVSKFLFFLLLVALVLAILGAFNGRSTV
jgi:hypothetical protein